MTEKTNRQQASLQKTKVLRDLRFQIEKAAQIEFNPQSTI